MVQKCENDRHFIIYCWFQLISIAIHIQAILDFQITSTSKKHNKLMPQSAATLEKKKQFFIKRVVFPVKSKLLAVEVLYILKKLTLSFQSR